MNLTLLILLPALTALAIIVANAKLSKVIALSGATIQLILSALLLILYMKAAPAGENGFVFESNKSWFPSLNINYHLGVDGISLSMILLTAIVVLAGVLVSWKVEYRVKEFFFLLILLSAGAYGFFISLDLFLMFFFLELAVIPKYLLIGIWGSGKKIYSANKLALMLMGGSALILVGLLGMNYSSGTNPAGFSLLNHATNGIALNYQMYFFPLLFVGFGVFTAIFPFHTWVPDGHSSAPTAASMFLAGISMKLGGYGCLRVAAYLMPEAAQHYSWIIVSLSVIAILYGALATMMQTDLKYMNAYSSVSHCGFVLLGIGMLTKSAVAGAVVQMVSHGLMTALFFAVIGILYDRTHTREVKELGGLLRVMPFAGTVFIIAGLCSLGLPGFSGFVAEMMVFVGSWERAELAYRFATVLACASIVVTAVYILRATGRAVMGPLLKPEYMGIKDAAWNEKAAAIVLIAGILIIGIMPFHIIDLVSPGTEEFMKQIKKVALNN
ncbi:MAG: NADH-quinone oxidoreductase subunit M [Bacteroidetes bacterium]|nr:MAG: NADH-quinone oxidoreductase subunit M [Bacteroidota bacterium]REK06484.1 MAG: NADH-quinone oxidoreductase subunit M [Bacteroidota bacterium]REK33250.1 MAG: NADH-quinone oxidoreductase subunit M [Bacteroidota bacterium]REK47087.1 MAG: NADH-quinone oxidoreductase subunit M [Bacteroidota bacterium]